MSMKASTVFQHYYQTVLTNPKVVQRVKIPDVSYGGLKFQKLINYRKQVIKISLLII